MKLNKKLRTLLQLDSNEVGVLEIINEITLSATEIQKHTRIPRATLDRLLMKLHTRGLIQKKKYSKKRVGWCINEKTLKSVFTGPQKNSGGLYLENKTQMLEAVEKFITASRNSRSYAIQSKRAWNAWIRSLSQKKIDALSDRFAKEGVVLDVIFSDDIDREILKTGYLKRPSSSVVIPKTYLNTGVDMEIYRNGVLIMDWEKGEGVHIKNPEIAEFFIGIFKYTWDHSKKYNIHTN